MKWYHMILSGAAVAVVFSIVAINPKFLEWPFMDADFKKSPPLRPNKIYQKLPADYASVSTSNFRYSDARTGESSASLQPQPLKLEWTVGPLNVGLHTASKSSPAIDDSGIYIGSDTGWFFKYSFSGEVIWKYYVGGTQFGVHATASLDQKIVYFGAYNGFMYALDKETGAPIWSTSLGEAIGSSTLLKDGYLYVGVETFSPANGFLAKLRARDGAIVYLTDYVGDHIHSSPVIDDESQTAIIGSNAKFIFGFDLKTGKKKWQSQPLGEIKGTLALWDKKVWAGSWDGNLYALDPATGAVLSTLKLTGRAMGSLAIDSSNGVGLIGSGIDNYGIDLKLNKILWKKTIYASQKDSPLAHMKMSSTIVINNGKSFAYTLCAENQFCALDPKTGKEYFRMTLPANLSNAPIVFKDRLYLSLDNEQGLWSLKN